MEATIANMHNGDVIEVNKFIVIKIAKNNYSVYSVDYTFIAESLFIEEVIKLILSK